MNSLKFFFKPRFSALFFSVSFLLTSCMHIEKIPMQSHESSSVFLEETQSERIPAPTESQFWDVTDVDISYVNPDKKYISFTFDDAPSKTLESILAVFAQYNELHSDCKATATLFCNGNRIDETYLGILHIACTLGFELGNHTYSHKDLTRLTNTELRREIDHTDEALYPIDGKKTHLFRAPYGKLSNSVKQAVFTPVIDWTIDTRDWTGISEENVYNAVWSAKFSGAIVLFHDGYPNTVSALKRLLPDLYTAGYQVLGVSAMAKANDCPLRKGGVYIRARKNEGKF